MSRYKLAFIQVLCPMQQVIIFSSYIGQNYIKHFTIKRANDVCPYNCKPIVCCYFVLCSYLKFVHIRQPSLCKGRGTTKWWKDCLVGSNRQQKFSQECKNYNLYLQNTIYRDNPSVLHLQNISLYTRETGEYVQIQGNYIGQNYNKLLAHSRRGEHIVRPNESVIPMGLLSCLQTINL